MTEIAKNIHITGSVRDLYEESPEGWINDREEYPIKVVGGLFNNSENDKWKWAAEHMPKPLRIIETSTLREEIRFQNNSDNPNYITVDGTGKLHSHRKYKYHHAAVDHGFRVKSENGNRLGMTKILQWYSEGVPHCEDVVDGRPQPAVVLHKSVVKPRDLAATSYINFFYFEMLAEIWRDGERKETVGKGFKIIFTNENHNTPEYQDKTIKWIGRHCKHGFFPFAEEIFGDRREEFCFLADIA